MPLNLIKYAFCSRAFDPLSVSIDLKISYCENVNHVDPPRAGHCMHWNYQLLYLLIVIFFLIFFNQFHFNYCFNFSIHHLCELLCINKRGCLSNPKLWCAWKADYPTIKARAATLVQLRLMNNLLNIYLRSKRFRATPSLARIYQNEILG